LISIKQPVPIVSYQKRARAPEEQRAMPKKPGSPGIHDPGTATREDLRRILGDLTDPKLADILGLRPSVEDLEEATMCLAGDQDVLAKRGHRVSATAARIAEILSEPEEEPPRPAA
jgi:hypothetical protein